MTPSIGVFAFTSADGTYVIGPIALDVTGPNLVVHFEDTAGHWYAHEMYDDVPGVQPTGLEKLVRPGASGIDAKLTRNSIRGRVTDTGGAPLAGIAVWVKEYPGTTPTFAATGYTDATGHYEAGPIAAGTMSGEWELEVPPLLVTFEDPERWYVHEMYNDAPGTVPLGQETLVRQGATGVDATLTRNSIRGRVTDSGGAPLAGIAVYVREYPGTIPSFGATGYTDATGHYEAGPIVAGTSSGEWGLEVPPLLVVFEDPEHWYVHEMYNDAPGTVPLGQETLVRQGATGVDATLTRNTISGLVTDSGGTPLAGIAVYVRESPGTTPSFGATGYTDATGHYETGRIAAATSSGEWGLEVPPLLINFVDRDYWYVHEIYNDVRGSVPTGSETLVRQGATGINAELTRNSVSGTVTDAAGIPLSGISVCVVSPPESPLPFGACTQTGSNGAYEAGPISSNQGLIFAPPLLVRFMDSGSARYLTEWYDNVIGLNPTGAETLVPVGSTSIDAQLQLGP